MTAVLPDLDAETVEELRPPCDVTTHHGGGHTTQCAQTAEWVLQIRCDECSALHEGLHCDQHKTYFVDQHAVGTCARCHLWPMRYTCLSVERL